MEINHLRVFYEVAKIGRFSETAKKLRISQSALSRSVALLEEGEGVKLFERSKAGVKLTPVGREVFLRAEQLFKTFEEIEGICRGTRETCEGPLRFATSDHVTNDLLVKPLQAFRRQYPRVVPSIRTGTPGEVSNFLLDTDCEFGLVFTRPQEPQIECRELRAEPMVLVCRAEIWERNKMASDEKTLKKVLDDVGYISSVGALGLNRPTELLQELFGGMPRIGLETNNQEAQKRFCLAGGGVAYLARFMVGIDIEKGRLVEIPHPIPNEFPLWIATRKGRQLSLAARTFLKALGDTAQ